jgi:hypothetical protein
LNKWKDKTFGDAGKFYPLLYLTPLPILGSSLFIFASLFANGFQLWERIIITGFVLFGMMYFGKAIEAINITRSTIKEIVYYEGIFRGKTFSGKEFEVDKFTEVLESENFFAKKHIKFLFQENSKNMIVRYNSDEYYLSGSIEGIERLQKLL